ncbi:hypothetical protein [Pseudoalteromonas luteoviolacea]|uniref:Cytochrome c domain-containing protein n=1 Tax=Pseudoalteromonas luteoviolacea NCIMB 1942 TaxID=1365253 RepID=A0A162A1Q8_9GAMM|nr:hypothetical protein [Pseudoalteromonas luteoviolacea]KZN41549.1 hypothetical protein N482_19930 [Pseudoalteromonas luteoviolacea NCIMB 1942]KZX00211.1 hypothetical protein JL49_12750 [Pseudoalteromonas luteoviolacea]
MIKPLSLFSGAAILSLLSTNLFATQQYATFPDWLSKNSCDYENHSLFLPDDITTLPYFPPDAYNKKICRTIKPLTPSDSDYQKKLSFLTNQYDLFSWAQFITLNREVDKQFKVTAKNLQSCTSGECNTPIWFHWRDTDSVFMENGCTPAKWDFTKNAAINPALKAISQVAPSGMDISQAILIDQNKQPVYYQKLLSPNIFNLVAQFENQSALVKPYQLYNIDGQIDYLKSYGQVIANTGGYVNCPDDVNKICNNIPALENYGPTDNTGGLTVKVAWKVLGKNDDPSKFIHMKKSVKVYENLDKGEQSKSTKTVTKTLGVVGFHIMHKTVSSPNWIFTTFSHQGNIASKDPLFNDRNCPTCPVNLANGGETKTQVTRLEHLNPITEEINSFVKQKLATENSVLQYYNLIGTQFSTDSSDPERQSLPEKIANYSGGSPYPVFLTNEVLETFLQLGNTPMGKDQELFYKSSSCMNCHVSGGFAAAAIKNVPEDQRKSSYSVSPTDFMFIFEDAHWLNSQACNK